MSAKHEKVHPTKLGTLTPEQQEVAFAHCERTTIKEGVAWLKAEYDLAIGPNVLSRWLQKKRSPQRALLPERKVRPDSKLGMLKREEQEELFEHCDKLTLEEGARWIKEKLGIELCAQALGVWLRKKRLAKESEKRLEEIRDNRDRATLVGNVFGAAAALTEANTVLIAQAVFEEFSKSPEQRDARRLIQYMNLALKDRTVNLARDRYYTDAAKQAMERVAEVQAINEGDEDEGEKIAKVIKVLFGMRPQVTTFHPTSPA